MQPNPERTNNLYHKNVALFSSSSYAYINQFVACLISCFFFLAFEKRRGRARTQVPTTRNYTLELPTLGVIAGVNPVEVQWKGLILRGPPSWSRCLSRQVSMLERRTASILSTRTNARCDTVAPLPSLYFYPNFSLYLHKHLPTDGLYCFPFRRRQGRRRLLVFRRRLCLLKRRMLVSSIVRFSVGYTQNSFA